MPSLWHYLSRAPMKLRKMYFARPAERLHLGSGPQILPGWVNVDNVAYDGVNMVLDVTRGLPFRDVRFIFAEHFIEHLSLTDTMYLLRECRRVLSDDGVLRLTTPNLDWVWQTHYRVTDVAHDAVRNCFDLNRAFRAWGHQFLYNEETLRGLLLDSGFTTVVRREYGQSEHPELRGIERHERYGESGELSDIIVVEASGRGGGAPPYLVEPRQDFFWDMGAH